MMKIYKNNTTGSTGVYVHKKDTGKPFKATIKINYKQKHIGYFATKEEARDAFERERNLRGKLARNSALLNNIS